MSLRMLFQRCVTGRQTAIQAGRSCRLLQQQTRTISSRHRSFQPLPVLKLKHVGFCTNGGPWPWENEYPHLPAYEEETERKEVYIVQVIGLPWTCSAEDLLNFFSDCRIRNGANGIHFSMDKMGRRMGQAFLQMENEDDVSKALEKHRQYIGQRYVEVFEVTDKDAEAILKKATSTPSDSGVVRLRGLPYSSAEADIVDFFSGLDIIENGITIVLDHHGRNSGEAFVQFSSPEAALQALQRNRNMMGHRYVEVYPSESKEISARKTKRSGAWQSTNQAAPRAPSSQRTTSNYPQSSTVHLHFVHMRGIPFNASGEDIVEFFSPLIVSKILLECSSNGRLNGEADVFFNCHRDAVAALNRDRKHIGDRYIELFLNSVDSSQR